MVDSPFYPDDELLRFLVDSEDEPACIEYLRVSWKMRHEMAFPQTDDELLAIKPYLRMTGTALTGEAVMFICVSRSLQDKLSADPAPIVTGVVRMIMRVHEHFKRGEVETITVVMQIERGFRLVLPLKAIKHLLYVITSLWPSYGSRILIVNLPSSLVWFVGFIKSLISESTGNKIEVVNTYERLLDFFDEEHLPDYYRERASIVP